MDFDNLYNIFHGLKFSCDITSLFKIDRIIFGSGGSNNIILDVHDKKENKLIIKIIPVLVYPNLKTKPDADQLEIKFYQFLTKKYLLTGRTPHIVGIYNHQNCSRIDKLLPNIRPSKKVCSTYQDKLTKKMDPVDANDTICDLMLRHQMKMVDPVFDVVFLEYCDGELAGMIQWYMHQIKEKKGSKKLSTIEYFIQDLRRILFQLIFTLAIVKEDYPGFLHGDFFARNILLSMEASSSTGDYVAYHYKQRIFYLPANGPYAKINDFGQTIIADELEPNTYQIWKPYNEYYHLNPFNAKTDIFNLLHDIYDGQNLGGLSILRWATELKIPFDQIADIRIFLKEFINVDTIDRINNANPQLLNQTWHIDNIPILEKSVRTPDEYLTGNYFEMYQELAENANVVRHYNQ